MEKKARSRNIITWVVVCLVILFFALAARNFWRARNLKTVSPPEARQVPVEVYTVAKGQMDWFLETTGDLRPMQEVLVFAKVPNKVITKILVDKGDWVDKGQLVASLEKDQIVAQINRAKAQVDLAQANLVVIQKDYKRIKNLYDQRAASRQKMDHIKAKLKVAKAQLKQAKSALNELKILYRDHDVYATVSGVVADRYVDPGSFSSPRSPIIRITNEKTLKLETSVPEKDFSRVFKGMAVEFWVDGYPAKAFEGKVTMVLPTLDPKTRTARVEIHVPNDTLLLRSGMFAHVKLYFGKKQTIIIPRDALNWMPGTGNYYVFVVKNGRAQLNNIKIGLRQGNNVEVISGLSQGDQVVIKGKGKLKDGTAVQVTSSSVSKAIQS